MEGNKAKMREALEYVIQWREECISEEGADNVDDMIAVVNAALSAPARQCDVGTAAEQEVRFKRFCESHWDLNKPGSACAGCPIVDERVGTECEFAWAQTPYAEEGGAK